MSNQISSILGILAFLKFYNNAVIIIVIVNVNLIKVFRKESVMLWRVNLTLSFNILVKNLSQMSVALQT